MLEEAKTPPNQPSKTVKAAIMVAAASFLAYAVYWAVQGVFWGIQLTQVFKVISNNQAIYLGADRTAHATLLMVQETCSVLNCYVQLAAAVLAFAAAVWFIRGKLQWRRLLQFTLALVAVFYLLLVPASIHHLVGVAFNWPMVSIGVGLSYLLQALLIAPPLLMLSLKIKSPQATHWATIAAPLFVLAMWVKYLFLWWDTLLPMGEATWNSWSSIGAANSLATLLVATILAAFAASKLRMGKFSRKLWGTTPILVGAFFVVDSLVALFAPIYMSFWYLTDFWMVSALALGIAVWALGPQKQGKK